MKTTLCLLLLFPATLLAQSSFDGTWIVKLDQTQLPKKPEVFLLQNGVYECPSCVPAIKVNADDKDHHVAGSPYFSSICIQQNDHSRLQITEKQKGKTVYSETDSTSPDGNTLLEQVTDSSAPNGEPVIAEETFQRIAPAPAGASAISGSWQAEHIKILSANGMTVTYHATNDGLEASTPGGKGYDAKFDGREYRVKGEPVRTTVSLKRVNARCIQETDREEGVVHYQVRMTVSRDGKSMRVTEIDKERGTKMTYIMEKKSA